MASAQEHKEALMELSQDKYYFIRVRHRNAAFHALQQITACESNAKELNQVKVKLNQLEQSYKVVVEDRDNIRKTFVTNQAALADVNKLRTELAAAKTTNEELRRELEGRAEFEDKQQEAYEELTAKHKRLNEELKREQEERTKLLAESNGFASRAVDAEGKLQEVLEDVEVAVKHLQTVCQENSVTV
jgi:DNA repair exonuclease SbcCD ATPase subunit